MILFKEEEEEEGGGGASPLIGSVHMKSPLNDSGPLQTADDEGVRFGPLGLHQLTFWKRTMLSVMHVFCLFFVCVKRDEGFCSRLTCYREVVERVGQIGVLRFVFIADERAVRFQQEVAWSPVLDVLT